MNLSNQVESLSALSKLSERRCHSLLIVGNSGCGKTWLSKQYASMLSISDWVAVEPTVAAIRSIQDACSVLSTPLVVNIENLDDGVVSAAYTLLKFLEEPKENVYVVVTARNIMLLPDTIASRCQVVYVSDPRPHDIVTFAQLLDARRYDNLKDSITFAACRSLSDVRQVYAMTAQQLTYLDSLHEVVYSTESVSSAVWKLGHYADNSPTPPELVIRAVTAQLKDRGILEYSLHCLRDLSSSRIAAHAVITRFVMDCRYGSNR